jgi:hypothetical protein
MAIRKHKALRLISAILRGVLTLWGVIDIWLANVQPYVDFPDDLDVYLPDQVNDTQAVMDCLQDNTLVKYENYDDLDDGFPHRYIGISNREGLVIGGTVLLVAEMIVSLAAAKFTNENGEAPQPLILLDGIIDFIGVILASIIASKTSHSYVVMDSFEECFPNKQSELWKTVNFPEKGDIGGAYAMAVVIAITQCSEFFDKITEVIGGLVD